MSFKLLAFCFGLFSLSTVPFIASQPTAGEVQPPAEKEEGIQWMTWEEAVAASLIEPRKIVVDVYTDWCGWCKRMDAQTFSDKDIAEFINTNYYAVKFNAEQKEDIDFNGETYSFVSHGRRGYHELAAEITQGRLSYPTVVFLNEKFELIQSIPGFQGPADFEVILTYFGGNHHMRTPWNKYKASYEPWDK
jgi:thioredoxin-related protein